MRTVHGFWSPNRGLCLWGEDSDRTVKSPSQATRRSRPHPFAMSSDALVGLHPGKPDSVTLLLPSVLTAPLDSPELVRLRPRPEPKRRPALLSWTVPVVCFDAVSAPGVLMQPDPELRYGASVDYLVELCDFASELAERGRVLPTAATEVGGYVARWRPVLQGSDLVAAEAMAAAMPPICRAEQSSNENNGQSPAHLVSDALGALVDAEIRRRLAPSEVLPQRRARPSKRTPAAEVWLSSLTSPDPHFEAESAEFDELAEELSVWADVGVGHTGPARATFRLTEADAELDNDGQWHLELLLQSVEDPSLLVPASQVWTGGEGLQRWLSRPDELLLTELGRASTIYPKLTAALREARPSVLQLDNDGAYQFLGVWASLLDQAGFGVLVPSWWDNRPKLGLTASASTPRDGSDGAGGFSRESLYEFDWAIALGDSSLTEEELESLAAAKTPLVRMRGEWVAVDPDQVRRGLEFLKQKQDQPVTATDVIALAASHPDDLDTPLPVVSVDGDGRLGDLLAGVAAQTVEPVDPPPGFAATLRPYQERGLSWLAFLSKLGLGACLADDMGLGKTIQLLALESVERANGGGSVPSILVCPMSLIGNWQREAERFTPWLRVYVHHGPKRLLGEELDEALGDTDILVTTYQTVTRDIDDLSERGWERVVLDEAQAVKNRLSRAARAVRSLESRHRVALTGTPMENRLAELWSIMDFLNPGILGSAEKFRSRYARPIERYGDTESAGRLRKIIRPYILRRVKTDKDIIDDLPDKIEIKQYCNLTAEQASLYQAVVDEMIPRIEESEGMARRGNVLATMSKLKQICNHPAQFLHDHSEMGRRSGKVDRLDEILEEILAEGDRALLFTQYTEFAQLLLPHLSARHRQDVLYLHGGTPQKRRSEMVQQFQSGEGPSLFLLSLKAGGTGLNLTAANHVIHLDRWWNPAVEDQATDRAFRIGQGRNVQVRKFVCAGTLEEKIDDMITQKKALADLVVNDGEGWLTELSTKELRELFAFSGSVSDE
ncbi:MAG TPA: DEAD/DEAH box helicase [Acidimicrobiia bacterium]|nr:DEAD/DEAH box helicase [Acidimicrobiia bacterium]